MLKLNLFTMSVLVLTGFLTIASVVGAGEIGMLQRVQTSHQMFKAGQTDRDPLLIIAAAKLRKTVGLEQTDRNPQDGNDAATAPDESAALTWHSMLDVARDLSVGDDLMLGLIDDIVAENTKGVVNGPVYNIANIAAKKSDTYNAIPFEAAKYAEIYVEGQGSADLNLFVYDSKNRLVCSDSDASDIAYCGWRPNVSDGFSIKVTNKGNVATRYSLMTN